MGLGTLRLAVGVMGNVASMFLYSAPMITFATVIKKKSTEGFSCVPYTLNCLLYTWYGLPLVSYKWENFPVVTVNGIGLLLELSFILIYLWFASPTGKKKVGIATMAVLFVFGAIAMISTTSLLVPDHRNRKMLVGSVGLVASVAMYASPLIVMKKVIKTRSVECMPFYLSFFSFLASALWMAYGLLGPDLFLAAPNLVGCPLGVLQLVLYCKYRKGRGVVEEPPPSPQKWDTAKINSAGSPQQYQHELQISVT